MTILCGFAAGVGTVLAFANLNAAVDAAPGLSRPLVLTALGFALLIGASFGLLMTP